VHNDRKPAILPPVIILAYDGEPVQLFVLKRDGAYLHVFGQDKTHPIGFPIDRAYAFEERKYRALRRAWEAKLTDKVSALLAGCAKWHEQL
jgi:hypothetical protein